MPQKHQNGKHFQIWPPETPLWLFSGSTRIFHQGLVSRGGQLDSHNNHPKPIPRKMNKKTKELLKKFCEMSQPGFNMEQTPTEPSAGGTLIYISQNLSYKLRKDLQIYCPKELESTFIELLISNRQSHLIGVVYKHPSMKHYKFNNNFMNTLLEKLR